MNTGVDYDDFVEHVNSSSGTTDYFCKEKKVNIGLGLAVGKKWKTQTHWVFEFNFGLGRNLSYNEHNYYYRLEFEESPFLLYPRAELSIGKRS